MILEFRGEDAAWQFLDKVAICSCETVFCDTVEGFDELKRKSWRESITSPIKDLCSGIRSVLWIVIEREGSFEKQSILCDGQAYLLNDEGKTISKF